MILPLVECNLSSPKKYCNSIVIGVVVCSAQHLQRNSAALCLNTLQASTLASGSLQQRRNQPPFKKKKQTSENNAGLELSGLVFIAGRNQQGGRRPHPWLNEP